MRQRNVLILILLIFSAGLISGCGNSAPSGPKETVIALFGAMEKDDRATIAHLLDLGALMQTYNEDYALQTNEPRKFTNPEQILDDLTGDGLTKERWFSMQRIVNEVEVQGDQATVEVTFVDKDASKGYRTRFGLHIVNDRWKIYSFNRFPTS